MGKVKKKLRTGSHKKQHPPTGGMSEAELMAAMTDSEDTSTSSPSEMLAGLASLDLRTREATCVAIASIFGNNTSHLHSSSSNNSTRMLKGLMRAGVIKQIIPLLVDSTYLVRLHATGALRNMSVTGGLDICEHMTAQDTITTLVQSMQDSINALHTLHEKSVCELLEQSVALCSNLCESSADAVSQISNNLEMITRLAELLSTSLSSSLQLEISKFLLILTDDNPSLCNALANVIEGLLSLIQNVNISALVRLHLSGIVLNVPAVQEHEASLNTVLNMLVSCISYDSTTLASKTAASLWEAYEEESSASSVETIHEGDEQKEKKTNRAAVIVCKLWKERMAILTLALEILANLTLGAAEEDYQQSDDDEWENDAEMMEDYDGMQYDERSVSNPLFEKHLEKFQQMLGNIMTILQDTPEIMKTIVLPKEMSIALNRLQIRALTCLSNSIEALPKMDSSPSIMFETLFNAYSAHVVGGSNVVTVDFDNSVDDFEAAISAALWAILRRQSSTIPQNAVTASHVEFIITRVRSSNQSTDARRNLVGLLGSIATSFSVPELQVAAALRASLQDTALDVVSEGLNAIFDVYGEDTNDEAFNAVGMLEALTSVSSEMKDTIRREARTMDPEVVAHFKETRLNLVRFIKYKKE